MRHRSYARQHPVFYDPGGNRTWRLLALLCLLFMAVIAGKDILLPQLDMPVYQASMMSDAAHARALLTDARTGQIPVLSESNQESGRTEVLTRVALIRPAEHFGQPPYLTDAVSGEFIRPLQEWEARELAGKQIVLERSGRPADRTLMLTFDDGPDDVYTAQVLDILRKYQVPATFFVIGENIMENPDVFRRIVAEGHMVGGHTYTHLNMDLLAHGTEQERTALTEAARGEMIRTDRLIRTTAEYTAPIWRLPEGDPDSNPLAVLNAQQLGYLQVDFDLDTKDWEYAPGETVPLPELDGHGHVMLLHDSGGDRSGTVAMLERLILQARAQGYSFSTLAPIIPKNYLPSKVTEPTFADGVNALYSDVRYSLPGRLLNWLFIFGVVSVLIICVLIEWPLVVYNHFRYKRQVARQPYPRWPHTVSVVVPAYNEGPTILRTLEALRRSTYPLLEVIVINDGSKDDTYALAKSYARKWSKLRVINTVNGGKPAALNRGFREARGDIVIALDGDTQFEPEAITALVRPFDDLDVGAVAGQVKVSNRVNLLTMWQSLEYLTGIGVVRNAQGLMGSIMVVPGACGAWHRQDVLDAGGFRDDTLAEDADMALTLRRQGRKIAQAPDAVALTEAPQAIRPFSKQRLRWKYGSLQALWKHKVMMFNPNYGWLGFLAMPYAALSVIIPFVFMPLAYGAAVLAILAGNWQSIVLFSGFIMVVQFVSAALALWTLREKQWLRHLFVVLAYRPIYEMLQVFVLYMSAFKIIRGGMTKFYSPPRIGDDAPVLVSEELQNEIEEVFAASPTPDGLTEIP